MMIKTMSTDRDIRAHSMPISGALRPYVSALMATEIVNSGPLPLAIVPHDVPTVLPKSAARLARTRG
jgi:hypothetical protein